MLVKSPDLLRETAVGMIRNFGADAWQMAMSQSRKFADDPVPGGQTLWAAVAKEIKSIHRSAVFTTSGTLTHAGLKR